MKYIKDWYFRGYEDRKSEIENNVVSRFARGNVLVQDGHYMTKDELEELSKAGDRALKRLERVAH